MRDEPPDFQDFVDFDADTWTPNDKDLTEPRILSAAQFISEFVAPDFIIDDLIQRGRIYSLTGRTGDGKSAIALAMSVAKGTGKPFGDRAVEKGRVVFLAGENPDDIRARFIMQCEHAGVSPRETDVHFVAGTFDIIKAINALRQKLLAIGGADLIIVDTLAAYFQGDEENSNTQLGGFARNLRQLCNLAGNPAVLVCCHPTKGASRKSDMIPRGGGAFLAEVDGNLCCFSEDKVTTELHWTGKLRGTGFEPMSFRMERRTSEAVKDRRGRLIPSVVAVAMNDEEIETAQKVQLSDQDHLLETMLNHPKASFADWCDKLGWLTPNRDPLKSKLHRRMEELVADKLARQVRGGRYVLTKLGTSEAKKIMGIQ